MVQQVQRALEEVRKVYPNVTHVFYSVDGNWYFCDDVFHGPTFKDEDPIDDYMMQEVADAVYEEVGYPAAFCIDSKRVDI